VNQTSSTVDALKNMGIAIDAELRSLLAYYGENPDSPDAPKPEDFFGLIVSFSSSLQVSSRLFTLFFSFSNQCPLLLPQKCALEVHDAQLKLQKSMPTLTIEKAPEEPDEKTIKAPEDTHFAGVASKGSQGPAAGNRSVGRGDFDQAIRSMREGKRRARPQRPLSKMFLDGSSGQQRQSRIYD